MKRRRLHLWLTVTGGALCLPAILWVATSERRLDGDDASIALNPIARIPLDTLRKGPFSATLIVPDTVRWKRIRKAWGEPEFVISAVEPTRRFTLCLPKMPARIELCDAAGRVVSLQPAGAPYGYSASCELSSLRFQAARGDKLTLKVTETGSGTVPAGYLIVVGDWFNTKDNLVGLDLDKDIDSLVKWLSIIGCLLVVAGGGVIIWAKVHSHRKD